MKVVWVKDLKKININVETISIVFEIFAVTKMKIVCFIEITNPKLKFLNYFLYIYYYFTFDKVNLLHWS